MSTCPICSTASDQPIVRRADVPIHQNTPKPDRATARVTPRGTIALHHCRTCNFAWNAAFDEGLVLYGDQYENDQSASPAFAAHLSERISRIAGITSEGHVVEIGCGNGTFLRQLVAESGCTASGYDPSYRGPTTEGGGRLRFAADLYTGGEHADLVVARHVIEHVADPVGFLTSLRSALDESPGARIAIETPAFEWILEGAVYQDLFYEHCSYFTEEALSEAARRAGLAVIALDRVFGGQYLWLEARPEVDPPRPPHRELAAVVERFADEERRRRDDAAAQLRRLAGQGKVAVWGAGAKGVTFVNLHDPDVTLIDCVIDLNPAKQGRFVPGSGHMIVPLAEAVDRGVTSAIVMNPQYLEECRALLGSGPFDILLELEPT